MKPVLVLPWWNEVHHSPKQPERDTAPLIPCHPPPGLSEWLPSGFFTAFLGLIWSEVKASEARVNQRIDALREDVKEIRRDRKETRRKVDELPMKIMELLRTANHPVSPDR